MYLILWFSVSDAGVTKKKKPNRSGQKNITFCIFLQLKVCKSDLEYQVTLSFCCVCYKQSDVIPPQTRLLNYLFIMQAYSEAPWRHCLGYRCNRAHLWPEASGILWFSLVLSYLNRCALSISSTFLFFFTLAAAMSYWTIRWLHPTASSLLSLRQVNPVTSELVTGSSLCKLRPLSKFHTCSGSGEGVLSLTHSF